ncbi:HlyD family secretion protein [Synechococcus sp. A10-1-5-9]|uniref:HlyD family secretion protein n=1 Tax=Synechococcus sp. A10-1-5-9 TaxID=3392295 RepID=UPI0039E8161F
MLEQRANDLVDRPFVYVSGSLAVLTVSTLLWSLFGSLKLESTGVGLIVRGKHFVTVSSKQQGVISKQYFELDQEVKAGDVLMSLDTQTNQIGLNAAAKTLEVTKPLSLLNDQAGKRAELIAIENIRSAEEMYKRNADSLRSLIQKQQDAYNGVLTLYSSNKVSSDELASAYSSLVQLKQQLVGLENSVREQRINYQQIRQSNAQGKINLESQNISTASNVAQSQLVLDQSELIRSPIDGTMVSYDVQLGGFVNRGDPLITISPKTGPLTAIMLVGSDQFGRIKKGDRVLVSPSASPSIRFGYIKGKVVAKADAPATGAELLKAFGSQDIVQSLQQSFSQGRQVNLPYLVKVQLEEKNQQPVWTLGRQPPWGVRSGSQATARIISEQVRPISLLIPFFRGL